MAADTPLSSRPAAPGSSARLVLVLFFASGALGLAYEVIWLRQLVLVFGSTLHATSAILSTFMFGLALGAFLAGRWGDRLALAPLRVYGLLELGVGACALLVPALLRGLDPLYRLAWEAGASESFTALSLVKWGASPPCCSRPRS